MKYLIKIIVSVLILQLLPFHCYAQPEIKYIRVAIVQDADSLNLKVNGFYEIIDPARQRILYRGKNLKTTVTIYKDVILIGKLNAKLNKIFIRVNDPDAISLDGRLFRGNIELIRKDNRKLLVVNHIELEDYLKGILYHEASHYWPKDALKAQAVICRSYAVYQASLSQLKDYDLTADVYSQVYGGKTSERYRTNKAVEETANEVLAYQGKFIPAYYHATCAGYTEDASLLWNIDLAPLKGVACSFCKDSPHFHWHMVLPVDNLRGALTKSGYQDIGQIKDILIMARDKSGRIINLKIITDKKQIEITAKDFRNIIGPNIIRSTNFSLNFAETDVVFEGLGWGHGVGLCQWGAYFMAKSGYSYQEILAYYYPGVEIVSIVALPRRLPAAN